MKNYLFFVIATALWGISCARQGSLSGGAKDTTPPAVDSLRSSPNYRTMFNERYIRLTFNEWVELKDVAKEVVISPPLDKFPKITLQKRTVVVDFGEEPKLRPNTTYTINFGNAVRDLTERNPAKNLRYVCSTGAVIDSFFVKGVVIDVVSGKTVENATVMLYDQMSDSIILKEKPYYFAKTDKTGEFSIQNIKEGIFKVVAIDEGQTPNLKWNGSTERIAFANTPVSFSDTSRSRPLSLSVFTNQGPLRVLSHSEANYGTAKMIWSEPAPKLALRPLPDTLHLRHVVAYSGDTATVWYDFDGMDRTPAWAFPVGKDTFRVKSFDRNAFIRQHRMGLATAAAAPTTGRRPAANGPNIGTGQAPATGTSLPVRGITHTGVRPFSMLFAVPVKQIDTSLWKVTTDTLPFREFEVWTDSLNPARVWVSARWKPEQANKLVLLPGAVTGFYGVSNVDTIPFQINALTEKQLGALALTVENTIPGISYIVEILSPSNAVERREEFTSGGKEVKLDFPGLAPGSYTVRLTADENGNGRWDTGDYFAHKQPELVLTKQLDPLRANWQLDASISTVKDVSKKRGE